MIKPVSIWGRGKHDKHVMIHFSCYLCKTKVFSYKTYTLINFVSFDEYNKWVFFFFFHFVSGQFKERVYGRIHLSFRYISRWDHSSAARSPNVPNYMWSCRKRCAYISKYIYRQDRSENEWKTNIPHCRDLWNGFVLCKLSICTSIKLRNKNKNTTV